MAGRWEGWVLRGERARPRSSAPPTPAPPSAGAQLARIQGWLTAGGGAEGAQQPQGGEPIAGRPAEAQPLGMAEVQPSADRCLDQPVRLGQGQGGAGHGCSAGCRLPAVEAAGHRHRQGQPAAGGEPAGPVGQLGHGIVQPLQGKAGEQQAGVPELGRQAAVEVPGGGGGAGERIAGQQFGAEVELEGRLGQGRPLGQQGPAEQAATGTEVGAGAGGEGKVAAEAAESPGHALLQAGLGLVAGGATPEALSHPAAEGGSGGIGHLRQGPQPAAPMPAPNTDEPILIRSPLFLEGLPIRRVRDTGWQRHDGPVRSSHCSTAASGGLLRKAWPAPGIRIRSAAGSR